VLLEGVLREIVLQCSEILVLPRLATPTADGCSPLSGIAAGVRPQGSLYMDAPGVPLPKTGAAAAFSPFLCGDPGS